MTNRAYRISIVICAYTEDRWLELLAAVESVRRQTLPAHEIILVIDHNPQLLVRTREQLRDCQVVENRQPRGLSGARNSGVGIASGNVIAFMDEDATAAPDWLERLACFYDDDDMLGVGGSIEPLWLSGRPRWFPAEFDWVVGCTYRGLPETPAPVRNLIGCNMSFRREILESLGGFRNGIGRIGPLSVGGEDDETELCIRLRQRWPSGELWYEPGARVQHRVPAHRAHWRYFRVRCFSEGLSKARVSRLVGADDGLSSERAYTLRTLPRGVLRGVADVIRRYDVAGLARSAVIMLGLALTACGYVYGLISLQRDNQPGFRRSVPPASLTEGNRQE
jgi:GT2 family glycosyltransferase